MKRLTRRKEDGTAYVQLYSDPDRITDVIKERARKEVEVIERLAYYEDLDEDGRLVELLCAEGDTIWELCKYDDNTHKIFPMTVKNISPFGSVRWVKDREPTVWNVYAESEYTYMYKSFCDFGKTVFATKEEAEANKLIEDAQMLEEIGCFALVLEKIPATLATKVAQLVSIPVIGIGAGGGVDGQVLVMHDMLGINKGFSPRFLRRYADLSAIVNDAVAHYIDDVKTQDFPNEKEQY